MADFSMFSPDGVNTLNVKDAPARNMVTDAFSPSTAYAVGDYCTYDGVLYICTTAHEGAWTSGDFTATTVGEELKNAGGDMSSYQTKNLETPLTINGESQTTVESALGALNTVDGTKQPKTMSSAISISNGYSSASYSTVESALGALSTRKQGINASQAQYVPNPDQKSDGSVGTYSLDIIVRSLAKAVATYNTPITPSTVPGYAVFLVISGSFGPGSTTYGIGQRSGIAALICCKYSSTNMSCNYSNLDVDSNGNGLITSITRTGQGTASVKLTVNTSGNTTPQIIPLSY